MKYNIEEIKKALQNYNDFVEESDKQTNLLHSQYIEAVAPFLKELIESSHWIREFDNVDGYYIITNNPVKIDANIWDGRSIELNHIFNTKFGNFYILCCGAGYKRGYIHKIQIKGYPINANPCNLTFINQSGWHDLQ